VGSLPLGGATIATTMSPIDGSSKLVEGQFCELRLYGVLGTSLKQRSLPH
jgi:hypothetical protein